MTADVPLGKPTSYPGAYDPGLLVGIPRETGRRALGLDDGELPFSGVDVWNAYEVSWLDPRGKPVVATAELRVPATSPALVESKSLKLYLNSLNDSRRASAEELTDLLVRDVGAVVGASISVRLTPASDWSRQTLSAPQGVCIDDLEVAVDTYAVDPDLLGTVDPVAEPVDEVLHSHLLKSNCPVTGQPDWATLTLAYRGPPIDRAGLLRYVVSYRGHDEFHEQCVERIFTDVRARCAPLELNVLARYTRRGGIDINPYRTDRGGEVSGGRLWRQ